MMMTGDTHVFRCAQEPDTDKLEVDMSAIEGSPPGTPPLPRIEVHQYKKPDNKMHYACILLSVEDTRELIEILQRMVAGPLETLVLDAERERAK